jgi:hypothetical protein
MTVLIRRTVIQMLCVMALGLPGAPGLGQLPTPLAGPAAKSDSPSPLEPIAWMAGSWAAEAKQPGVAKSSKILTKFTPQLDGRLMMMETSFDGQSVYQGVFGYDPAQKAIAFWYVTPNGESIRGTVAPKGSDSLYDFHMTLINGIDLHFQTNVHRVDSDRYTWSLFTTINKGSTWEKLFEVEYRRVP